MGEQKKPRVPLVAVIVGGLVAGAALFGAFRGMNAQPLPAVEVKGDDPFGALPLPALPPADASPLPAPPAMTAPLPAPALPPAAVSPLPPVPVQQTGAVVPGTTAPLPVPALPALASPPVDTNPLPPAPVTPTAGVLPPVTPIQLPALPKVDAKPDLPGLPPLPTDPKPVELPVTPKADPLPVLPPAKIDPIPETKPAELKPVDPLPKPAEVAPVLPKLDPVVPTLPKPTEVAPTVPKLDPVVPMPAATLPKPAELPQPVTPTAPPAGIPPVKPENGLRPELPPLTVNPGPAPVGPDTPAPPKKAGNELLPLPRPVVEESVSPTPPPDAARIAAPTTPGSTPMPVSRHALLSTVMGAALAAAPAFADDPKPADAEAIKALQKQIDDMKKDLDTLKTEKKKLEKDLYGITDSARKTDVEKGVVIRLDEAEKAAAKMADKVKDLESQLALKSVSEKSPLGGASPTISAGRGLVKIVNEYNTKVAMVVNGISYPLAVNEVKQIEVPEGKLKYELVDFPNAVAKETTIKEGETVTLRIK